MKKYFLIAVIITMSIMTIFSCRKSFDPQPSPGQNTEFADETEIKVQEFLNSMKTPLKSESTHTIEDAIWYLEATLNFSYAIYDSDFVYFSKDTSNFSIDLNLNGTVNHNDLLTAFADMVDSLETQYDAIQSQTKHVMLCDVIDVSNSVNPLDLQMISFIVYDFSPMYYDEFGPTEYWFSGGLAGMCGDSIGHHVGQDATTELTYKLNHPLIANAQNVRIYYNPVVTIFDINGEDYEYGPAPRGTRGYWYGSDNPEDGVQCLEPDELNFYLSSNGIPYIIAANDTFIDKEFCLIEVIWDFIPSTEIYFEHHFYNISYGVRHETQIGISPL